MDLAQESWHWVEKNLYTWPHVSEEFWFFANLAFEGL